MYKALMMTLLIHLPVVVVFGSAALFIAMAAADAGVTTVTVPNSNNTPWPSTRNQDMEVAKEEMQRANYVAYVMLINLAPSHLFLGNVTFLMPNDRALANNMSRQNIEVADFLLRHSIPSPLLMEDLQHFPTGSKLPTCTSWRPPPPNNHDQLLLGITNNGRRSFFLNNVRIISPNICTRGSSIRCHGIDGVIQDPVPPAGADQCHNNNNNSSGTTTPPSPSPSPSPSAAAPTTDDKNDTSTNSGSNADHPKKSAANSVVVVNNKCYFGGGCHEILRSGCLSLTLVLLTLMKHCP